MKIKKAKKLLKAAVKKIKELEKKLEKPVTRRKAQSQRRSNCSSESDYVTRGSSTFKRGSAIDGGQTVEEIKADRRRYSSDSGSSSNSVPGGGPAGSAIDGGQTVSEISASRW